MIIVTDGDTKFDPAPAAATTAKNAGIRIITIGFGDEVRQDLLRNVASSPADYHYVSEDDASKDNKLVSIYDGIGKDIPLHYS